MFQQLDISPGSAQLETPEEFAANSATLQFPEELVFYVMQKTEVCGRFLKKKDKGNSTHPFARLMGFFIFMKAQSPGSSLIQNYTSQITDLSQKYKCSRRSFFSYMRELKEMGLIKKDGKHLRIASWKDLGKTLQINTKKRTKIIFNYDSKQKIHWWFAALEIKSNQDAQAYMIWKKVNKNLEVKNDLLMALKERGFDMSKADNPDYLSGQLFWLYIEDFRTGTDVHDALIHIRADVNRGCERIAEDWNMSPQLVGYWKKQMVAQEIIGVSKLVVISQYTRETKECHKNEFCHVTWNEEKKQRVWFLCDQISVLMPWKWQEFLEKNIQINEDIAA